MKKIRIGLVIACATIMHMNLFAQDALTIKDVIFMHLKLNNIELDNDELLNYAKTVHRETYNKYHNDEFEWYEKFEEIKQDFQKQLSFIDSNKVYMTVATVDFSDYDFSNEGYPISKDDWNKDTVIKLREIENFIYAGDKSIFYKGGAIEFSNIEDFNFLKMDKQTAKTFLQSRKYPSGNINREITLIITCKVDSIDKEKNKTFLNYAKRIDCIPLIFEIENVDAYDSTDRKSLKKIGTLTKQ